MISTNPASYGNLEIAGNLTRTVIQTLINLLQKEETYNLDVKSGDDFHIGNIGRLIEANETEIRTEMDGIYINKTKQIVNTGRLKEEYMTVDEKLNFQRELQEAMNQMKLDKKKGQ